MLKPILSHLWVLLVFYVGSLQAQSQYLNDYCTNAISILSDNQVIESLGFASLDDDACGDNMEKVHGIWYVYEGKNTLVEISFIPEHDENITIHIFEGNCQELTCVEASHHRFFANDGVLYYILVAKNVGSYGQYQIAFSLSEKELALYDNCEGALIMDCDSSYQIYPRQLTRDRIETPCFQQEFLGWLQIDGDGLDKLLQFSSGFFTEFSYAFYENDCDSLNCLYSGNSSAFRFSSIPGKKYYLAVTHENLDLTIPVTIQMTCVENNLNNTCANATTLGCDQFITAELSDTIPPDLVNVGVGAFPGFWYRISGNSQKHLFTLQSQAIENLVISFFIVKSGDCTQQVENVIYNPYPLSDNEYIVHANQDEDILVKVAYFNAPTNFTIGHHCFQPDTNFDCIQAKNIICADTIEVYETAKGDFSAPKTGLEGNYFNISGSADPYTFNIVEGEGPVIFTIYEMDCDSLVLLKSFEYFCSPGHSFSLDLPVGQQYILKTHFFNFNFQKIVLSLECSFSHQNIYCNNALPIFCGEMNSLPSIGPGFSIKSDDCSPTEGYWYSFEGNDSIVSLSVSYPFQQYSLYEGICGTLTCLYANPFFTGVRDFRIHTESGKKYYIKMFAGVNSFPRPTFTIQCYPPSDIITCDNASFLVCGETVTLEFNSPSVENAQICSQQAGVWYFIEGNNSLIKLSTHSDVELSCFEGRCDSLSCISTNAGNLHFYGKEDFTYYIKVDSRYNTFQELQVSCTDIDYNACETPINMTCGDSIMLNFSNGVTIRPDEVDVFAVYGHWLSLEGTGDSYVFQTETYNPVGKVKFYIYDEHCDQYSDFLIIPSGIYSWNLATEFGKKYKILLACENQDSLLFNVECITSPEGASCNQADLLECGQIFDYSSEGRTSNSLLGINAQYWFTFSGNGNVMTLSSLDPNNLNSYRYIVYKAVQACDNLQEVAQFIPNGRAVYWRTEVGVTYYVVLGEVIPADVSRSFELQCFPNQSSSDCDSAPFLECGIKYSASTKDHTSSFFGECAEDHPGTWFQLSGDDLEYEIQLTNLFGYPGNINVLIGQGICDSITCLVAATLSSANPSIRFATQSGSNYIIKFEGSLGDEVDIFDFRVLCQNQAENDNCALVEEVVCGSSYSGRLGNLQLDDNNACRDVMQGLYYTIQNIQGEISLSFSEIADENMVVNIYQNSCDSSGICLYETTINQFNPTFKWLVESQNSYSFRLSSPLNSQVSFVFDVACNETPENVSCSTATELLCDDVVNISLCTPLAFQGETPCHFTEDARVFWYLLPRTTQVMEVEIIDGKDKSHYVSVLAGICGNTVCQQVFDINQDKLLIETDEDFNYYLAIHGDAQSNHDFSFILRCIDKVANDECYEAQILQCGDTTTANVLYANYTQYFQDGCSINPWKDVWYEVEGTGDILEFKFNSEQNFGGFINVFIKGECNNLSCVTNGIWRNNSESAVFRFVSDPDQTYLFSIQHPIGDTTSFTLQCTPRAVNDLCEGSLEWIFNDTTVVDIAGSTGDEGIPCYNNQRNGVWYHFEGNGGYVSFESGNPEGPVVSYILLEGDCHENICIDAGIFSPEFSLDFRTDLGKKYFLVLYGNSGLIKSQKGPLIDNHSCLEAVILECNVSAIVQSRFTLPDPSGSSCANPDENTAWYKIEGDGQVRHFTFSTSGAAGSLDMLTACGDTCLFKHVIDSIDPAPLRWIAAAGEVYLLKLNISRLYPEQVLILTSNCEDGQPNYSPSTATVLSCDEFVIDTDRGAINPLQTCFEPRDIVHWYFFEGNDSLFTIPDTFPMGVEVLILDENCLVLHNITTNGGVFQTVKNQKYYLAIRYQMGQPSGQIVFRVLYKCIVIGTKDEQWNELTMTAAPNPFTLNTQLHVVSKHNGNAILDISDVKGRLIERKNIILNVGNNIIQLEDFKGFVPGVYVATLLHNGVKRSVRLVKL
ncbi:MAG: T9SS type A sorting domain-containing protein [Saprospiraceae bacterium]